MESLSLCLSYTHTPPSKPHKTTLKTPQTTLQIPHFTLSNLPKTLKPHLCYPILVGLFSSPTLPSLASEIVDPTSQVSQRINLESTLVSIDEFFNKYPFFVAGVTFIWLIGIPLLEEYLCKFKFISALNSFKKLRDHSSTQLLDIRDEKSVAFLSSPNLRFVNKDVVQVPYVEGDDDGFVRKVMDSFVDPQNTIVCILDSFNGNSMKVAELLVKNGFKEAYAIEGGVRGKKGWQEIQEEFLPPAVHVFRRKKVKKTQKLEENGAVNQLNEDQVPATASDK